jgi:hypothetical protein
MMKAELSGQLEAALQRANLTYGEWEHLREKDWKKRIAEQLPELGKTITTGSGFFTYLESKKIFDRRTAEDFKQQTGAYAQVSSMLKALEKLPFASFICFCEVLIETNQTHVVAELLTPENVPSVVDTERRDDDVDQQTPETVDYDWRACVGHNFVRLIENIELKNGLMDKLLQHRVIDDIFADVVKETKGRSTRVSVILDHLVRYRSDGDFIRFCRALTETNQAHIVTAYLSKESLHSTSSSSSSAEAVAQTTEVKHRLEEHDRQLKRWLETEQVALHSDWRNALLQSRSEIVDNLESSDEFISCLAKFGVFNMVTSERCREEEDLALRSELILDHMHRRSSGDFRMFCEALRCTEQSHIILQYLSSHQQSASSAGKDVPDTPVHPL